MSLAELVEAYLASCELRGLTASTRNNQRSHLRGFVSFLESQELDDVALISRDVIDGYLEHMRHTKSRTGKPIKAQTRNQRLVTLKCFCSWLVDQDLLATDPAESVQYSREPKHLPRNILSVEQMAKLLAAPDPQTVLGMRDRVALELLYSTAVRVAELCGLDVGDVDAEGGFARVRQGKGNRDRVVPVGRLACELVESYLADTRPKLAVHSTETTKALILSQYGRRLGVSGVSKVIARHAVAAGLSAHITPHTFRHTCATHMLRGGASIRHLQELLGHQKLTSTEVYTKVTISELRAVHERYHPRGDITEADVRLPRRDKD